jgi:type IV secretory pathway TrbD component
MLTTTHTSTTLPAVLVGADVEIETINVGLAAMAMVVYLVIGFFLSIWISKKRQLA